MRTEVAHRVQKSLQAAQVIPAIDADSEPPSTAKHQCVAIMPELLSLARLALQLAGGFSKEVLYLPLHPLSDFFVIHTDSSSL